MIFAPLWQLAFRKYLALRPAARRTARRSVRGFTPHLETLESRRLLTTYTWISSGGDWDVDVNWSCGQDCHGVPGPGDTAIINSASASVLSHGNDAVGTLLFSNGALTVTGSLTVGTGMTLSSPGGLILNGGTLHNQGAAVWQGPGGLFLNQSASLDNTGSFNVNTSGDSTITGTGGAIVNGGIFSKSSGGITRIDNLIDFNTRGDVNVLGGTLVLAGRSSMSAGTMRGIGTVRVTGALDWAGGTMDDAGKTEIVTEPSRPPAQLTISTLADHFILGGRTLENGSLTTWTAASTIWAGDGVRVNNLTGATFDALDDGAFLTYDAGGTWTFHNDGLFRKMGGTNPNHTLFDPGSIVTNLGTVEVNVGTLTLAGTFTNFDSAAMTLTAGIYKVIGIFQFNDAAIVNNAATIFMDGPTAQIIDQNGNDALNYVFTVNLDAGRFTLRNGATLHTDDFLNLGQVFIESGSHFTVDSPFTYTQQGGATTLSDDLAILTADLVDIQAGLLVGWGTIEGLVQNAGELRVGGDTATHELTIQGDFIQTSSGITRIKINGEIPQTPLYDKLTVTGQVTLDGTLKVIFLSDQAPRSDFLFDALHYGSRAAGTQFQNLEAPFPFAIVFLQYHDDQGKMDFFIDFA